MKRTILMILMCAALMNFAGCGKQNDVVGESDNSSALEVKADDLVTDAYKKDCTYATTRYNAETGKDEDVEETCKYRIPKINLTSSDVDQINKEVYDTLYPVIEDSVEEIQDTGRPETSEGVTYEWILKDDILSLVIKNDSHPDASNGPEYMIYNISVSEKNNISKEEWITAVGWSEKDYQNTVKQALGTAFFQEKESYIDERGYDEFFRTQLEKTISAENIEKCQPYFNKNGEPCIIGAVYSLAGAEYYWNEINLQQLDDDSAFNKYMKAQSNMNAQSKDDWKKAYLDYIDKKGKNYDSLSNTYMETYKLVDVNGDATPELYINFGTTASGDVICTYYQGKVVEQSMWDQGFSYIEGQNMLKDSGGHMDGYYDKIYSIQNGKFVLLNEGSYGAEDNSNVQFDSNGEPIYNYYWNNKKVSSETEYMNLLNKAYNAEQATNPFDGAEYNDTTYRYEGNGLCDYKEIVEAIQAY